MSPDRPTKADAPERAPLPEVKITPEMIEAGLAAYRRSDPRFDLDVEIVASVFCAMEAARRLQRS